MNRPARWSDSVHPAANPNYAVDSAMSKALGHYDPPSFPTVIATALAKLRDPEVPLREVARTLAFDPRLTIKLLNLMNSPAYAFRNPVLSVEHAVALLGREQVETMLLSMGVRGVMPNKGGSQMDRTRYWQAAARRAAVARALAHELEERNAATSFAAALLQDMAVPVLSANAGEAYDALLRDFLEGAPLARLEDAEYGWNHADVAGWMCERWRFPEELTGAIGAHHRGHRSYSSLPPPPVMMVATLREGPADYGQDEFIETTAQRTGLSTDRVKAVVAEGEREAAAIANAYL